MGTEKARVFLTVLQKGSFTAAAEPLGYTTSGVSRSIASLEDETGVALLIRDRKGVRPTKEAAMFIPIFERMVEQDRSFHETVDQIHGLETGSITIGISYSAYFRIMADNIKAFTNAYPGIEVRTIQGISSELLEALDSHQIDFAIMTKREGNYRFCKLLEDPMVACVSKQSPLAQLDVFPLARFADEAMAVAYPDLETDYRRALAQYGITPNIKYSTSDIFAAYCMVEAGLGVSLSNRLEVSRFDGDVALLRTDPPINLEIGIMYTDSGTMTVAARKFLSSFLDEIDETCQINRNHRARTSCCHRAGEGREKSCR